MVPAVQQFIIALGLILRSLLNLCLDFVEPNFVLVELPCIVIVRFLRKRIHNNALIHRANHLQSINKRLLLHDSNPPCPSQNREWSVGCFSKNKDHFCDPATKSSCLYVRKPKTRTQIMDIVMEQEVSNPSFLGFLGIISNQNWPLFLDLGVRTPKSHFFCTQKRPCSVIDTSLIRISLLGKFWYLVS